MDKKKFKSTSSIGIFDSGLGGLSVLREIRKTLPAEAIFYVADQAHIPYGVRAKEEVRLFSEEIVKFMFAHDVKVVVIACNTASAAALNSLRATYPERLFVGMEPAVKPAAESTQTGVVGVLATPATFQSELYASMMERFAQDVIVMKDTCSGLVEQIEMGAMESSKTMEILQRALEPMLKAKVDTIVLGCTHYPFAIPQIRKIVGEDVRIIDPASSVARHVKDLLEQANLLNVTEAKPGLVFNTSHLTENTGEQVKNLLGEKMQLHAFDWDGTQIKD